MAKLFFSTVAAVISVLIGFACAQTEETEIVTEVDCNANECPRSHFMDEDLVVEPEKPCYSAGDSVTLNCTEGAFEGATENTCGGDGSWDKLAAICDNNDQALEDNITLFCEPGYYYIKVPGDLLGNNDGNAEDKSRVVLGDPDGVNCGGYAFVDGYMIVNSSYTQCGTEITVDSEEETLVYENTLRNYDPEDVTTMKYFEVDLTCVFNQNNLVSSTAIINVPIYKDLNEEAKYDISFRVFTDETYTTESEVTVDTIVDTDTEIYLLAEVNDVDELNVFPTRCWATPQMSSNYSVQHDLIENGCRESDLVSDLVQDASSNPNFAFTATVFRFTKDTLDQIYIHCDLKVCPSCDLPADPETCGTVARRRRSTDIAFSRHVSSGPIRMTRDAPAVAGSAWQLTALTVYSAMLSAVMLSAAVMVIAVRYRRGKTTAPV